MGVHMPRAFDSDEAPSTPVFGELVDCPFCGERFEGEFADREASLSVQDMAVVPIGDHQCPFCDRRFSSPMTGWVMYGEAG